MEKPCKEKQYNPAGGDPYPAPVPPTAARILMALPAALLRITAILPPCISRGFADILALMARYVVRYRLNVVRRNVHDCFPELSSGQQKKIVNQFYRNLADYFFQTVRIAYCRERSIFSHISFEGQKEMMHALRSGRNILLYTSHFGNWEYIPALALFLPDDKDVIFAHVNRPLKNLWFNRFFHRLRSRFNTSVPMHQTARAMIGWQQAGRPFIIGFLSDQKPGRHKRSITVDFLGRQTPFLTGGEELARKLKCAVYYTDMQRTGRDRFNVRLQKMTDDASLLPVGQLTAEYAKALSRTIRRDPASYLWSHNRWHLSKEDLKKKI